MIKLAYSRGYIRSDKISAKEFNFADTFREPIYSYFADGHTRQTETFSCLKLHKGQITPKHIMDSFRNHRQPNFSPDNAILLGCDICMHAGFGPVRGTGTTGTLLAILSPKQEETMFWVTGTCAPCLTVF